MKHSYDYQCRCSDCVIRELTIRAELKKDNERRLAAKYGGQQVTLSIPAVEPEVSCSYCADFPAAQNC